MTPWEVIEEALVHRRPPRNMTWLAEKLGETIQVVSNWKKRGVPVRRIREIAKHLDLTPDQVEGLEPLPWDVHDDSTPNLSPDVADIAVQLEQLTREQRELFVLPVVRSAISGALRAAQRSKDQSGRSDGLKEVSPKRMKGNS